MSSFVTASKKPKKNLIPLYKPHKYQKKGIKFIIQNGAAGLFWDPGLGKTSTILGAYKILKKEKLVKKMLVIAPLRVAHSVWPQEALKWKDFNKLKVVVVHGPKKAELLKSDADIYVINPEGLKWLEQQSGWKFEMLVVDESTKFKRSSTKKYNKFSILRRLLKKFRRRYILTGTPSPNGLIDLFGQIYILDQGAALGAYITHYRNNFFNSTGFGGYTYVPQEGASERINELLRPLVQRLDAEDYLNLPPLITTNIMVDLPPAAMKIYNEVEKEFISELEGDVILVKNAAIASSKCRQLASGGIYLDDSFNLGTTLKIDKQSKKKPAKHVHDAKTDALEDLIEELSGQPALVAYDTHHDLDRIRGLLGKDVPYIGGGVSAKRGRELERLWNLGELPVLCVQPQSVAHGLNLQEAGKAIIWYSLTWDLEAYLQLYKRLLRQGRKEPVFMYHIIARGTIDEAILKRLDSKDNTQKALLNALREHYSK